MITIIRQIPFFIAILFFLFSAGCVNDGGDKGGADRIVLRNNVPIDPMTGGSAAIKTVSGDILQVTIPAGALEGPIVLTLTETENPLPGAFQDIFFQGVRMDPENLTFQSSVALRIRFARDLDEPSISMLFHDAGDGLALAVKQRVDKNEIRADIYRTGRYFGACPAVSEAKSILDTGMYSDSTQWQDTLSVVNALNAWAAFFTSRGLYDEPEMARRMIEENIRNDISAFLRLEIPSDVMAAYCSTGSDPYADSADEYQKMLKLLGEDSELTENLWNRWTLALEIGLGRLFAEEPLDPCGPYRDCVIDYLDLFNGKNLQNHPDYENLKNTWMRLNDTCGR